MALDVLPGPSLAELARTAVASATAAAVTCGQSGQHAAPAVTVAWRAGPTGEPVLLPAAGSPLARQLAASPTVVTARVPARPPFSALRLTGTTRPGDPGHSPACGVTLRSAEFTGGGGAQVSLVQYHAALPDPLWRHAAGVLRHLEHGHLSELIACVRAHGLQQADWVVPSGLDRFGLKLLVLTADGISEARLSFPGGPVSSFDQLPTSLRVVLACRCPSAGATG